MKCPLMTLEYRLIDQGGSIYIQECLKEECAWWNPIMKECICLSINRNIMEASNFLGLITGKMPHEEQFRR